MKDFEKIVLSVDGIINALYESISFKEGGSPDWDLFRKLMIPDAKLIHVKQEGVDSMDAEMFIARFKDQIKSGAFKSFYEYEIHRTTNEFSYIAQVFSTYEAKFDAGDKDILGRGINCIELIKEKKRWWIAIITWEVETQGKKISKRYLPAGYNYDG